MTATFIPSFGALPLRNQHQLRTSANICPTPATTAAPSSSRAQTRRMPPTAAARRTWTRRDAAKLLLSVSVGTLASSAVSPDAATAAAAAPVFEKDETGIQYFDIKVGNGASPIDGDFVIIDYVGCDIPDFAIKHRRDYRVGRKANTNID